MNSEAGYTGREFTVHVSPTREQMIELLQLGIANISMCAFTDDEYIAYRRRVMEALPDILKELQK